MSAPLVRLFTPRQQKEARAVIKAMLRDHMDIWTTCTWKACACQHKNRLHDRARLWLAHTDPKRKQEKNARQEP